MSGVCVSIKASVMFPYSRRSDSSVSLLSRCVPDLSLDSLAFYLDAASGELHPDGALALQIELIPSEARQQVTLPYTGVSYQHHCRKEKLGLKSGIIVIRLVIQCAEGTSYRGFDFQEWKTNTGADKAYGSSRFFDSLLQLLRQIHG